MKESIAIDQNFDYTTYVRNSKLYKSDGDLDPYADVLEQISSESIREQSKQIEAQNRQRKKRLRRLRLGKSDSSKLRDWKRLRQFQKDKEQTRVHDRKTQGEFTFIFI